MEALNVEIKNTDDLREIIVREGKAPELHEKPVHEWVGDIKSPANYHVVRHCTPDKSIIEYSRYSDVPFIKLTINDEDALSHSVVGNLNKNPELNVFKLNTGSTFSLAELGKVVLRNRHLFATREDAEGLIKAINLFKARLVVDIERSNDNRGNRKELIEQSASTALPSGFNLSAPIYIGFDKRVFRVEICFDVTDSVVNVFLESPDLIELMKVERDTIINQELSHFQGLCSLKDKGV